MADDRSDFEKLIGPDRRQIPKPDGLAWAIVVIAILIILGLLILWPRSTPEIDVDPFGFADDVVRAQVEIATVGPCPDAPEFACSLYQLTVIDEPAGEIVFLDFLNEVGQPIFVEGDTVFLAVTTLDDGTLDYQFADRDRRAVILVLALVFAATVIALGRMRGVAALAGLAISVAILVFFILPAIVAGSDAMFVALVGGGAIALVSLYLAHGYNPLTHVAALGAFSALVLTTVLSWLVVEAASFSGLTSEESFLLLGVPDLDLSGLILAGIVLGAIGALDDVTVTQASAVWEVHTANPTLDSSALFESGIRVGRDHIVSTVNTLLLAYAGASLPLLLFFTISAQSFGLIASSEVVAVEIVRTLVGSIGLVAAVPITTWLGSRVISREASVRVAP